MALSALDSGRSRVAFTFWSHAAALMLRCAGLVDDRRYIDRGGKLRYAMDTDVVVMYMEPEKESRYGAVFQSAGSPISVHTTLLLADFLFDPDVQVVGIDASWPGEYAMFGAHRREMMAHLTGLHRQLAGFKSHRSSLAIARALADFGQHGNDSRLVNDLVRNLPELVALYRPFGGPRAALARFAALRADTFSSVEDGRGNMPSFPSLESVGDTSRSLRFIELAESWMHRLENVAHRDRPRGPIRADAAAMASLEFANESGVGHGERLCLITGSDYLFRAAYTYQPEFIDNGQTFADAFLRHPQAFLSHPQFFAPGFRRPGQSIGASRHFQVWDWLTVLFPNAIVDGGVEAGVDVSWLRTVAFAVAPPDAFPSHAFEFVSGRQLIDRFSSQIETAAASRYKGYLESASSEAAQGVREALAALRAQRRWEPASLRTYLLRTAFRAVRDLWAGSVWIGQWAEAGRADFAVAPVLRCPEAPLFEDAARLVVQMQIESLRGSDVTVLQGKVTAAIRDVEGFDPEHYYAFVIHALAFLAKGHWDAAAGLGELAIAIADSLDVKLRGARRGREAAYVAAVASRRGHGRSGLGEASRLIQLAIARSELPADEVDVRYLAEAAAIELRTIMYAVLIDDEPLDAVRYEVLVQDLDDVLTRCDEEESAEIAAAVRREVLIDMLTLHLLGVSEDGPVGVAVADHTRLVRELSDVLEHEEGRGFDVVADRYGYLVRDVAAAVFGVRDGRAGRVDDVLARMDAWVPAREYDEARNAMYRRLLAEFGAASQ